MKPFKEFNRRVFGENTGDGSDGQSAEDRSHDILQLPCHMSRSEEINMGRLETGREGTQKFLEMLKVFVMDVFLNDIFPTSTLLRHSFIVGKVRCGDAEFFQKLEFAVAGAKNAAFLLGRNYDQGRLIPELIQLFRYFYYFPHALILLLFDRFFKFIPLEFPLAVLGQNHIFIFDFPDHKLALFSFKFIE